MSGIVQWVCAACVLLARDAAEVTLSAWAASGAAILLAAAFAYANREHLRRALKPQRS
jgi:hypothetical protein